MIGERFVVSTDWIQQLVTQLKSYEEQRFANQPSIITPSAPVPAPAPAPAPTKSDAQQKKGKRRAKEDKRGRKGREESEEGIC